MTNIVNQFQGGMWQDDHFVSIGQSIYSHGINITQTPWELKLMPPIEVQSGYTEDELTTSIFSPENGTIWYGTGGGLVKNFTSGATVQDTGFTLDVMDWILFLWKFYIFTGRYVFKTTYTSGALSSLSTWYDPWVNEGYHHPVVYQGGEMYFPSGKNVKYTDSTGVIQTLFTTDFSNNVRAVSVQGNTLRIYTENLLSIVDIGSKTVSYSQVLPFVTNGVKSDGKVDYVTTDWDELYVCSGLEWRKIAEYTNSDALNNYLNIPKFTFKSSVQSTCIAVANGRVYTLDRISDRLLIYGKKMEGLPQSFSYWPIHDNQSIGATIYPITNFSAVFAQGNIIYVGYTANSLNRLGSINTITNTTTACFEWVYIIPPNDFGDYSILKSIDEIRVGKEGTTGQLWASIDDGTYELVDTLNQTELYHKVTTYKKDFRKISFMVKMYSTVDKITNIDLRFNTRQV